MTYRCGLSHKNKLSYEKFLSAFQDHRLAGYGRVTLDTPEKVATPVVFERHENLSADAAISKLRNKIGENPETIQRVSDDMKSRASHTLNQRSLVAACILVQNSRDLWLKY